MIRLGTNRLVLLGKNFVYKIPLFSRGRRANLQEYHNYLCNADVVAKTMQRWYGLKQERLHALRTFPRHATAEEIPEDLLPLFQRRIHNRLQVGKDKDGQWRFFDFEDVKYYERQEYLRGEN